MPLLNIFEPGQSPSPHEEKDEIAIGIDLGTTNSLVAIKENDQIIIIPDHNGQKIQPSIVKFLSNNQIKYANEALSDQNEGQTIFSIKRLIDENSLKNSQITQNFPHQIVKNINEPLKIIINDQKITPTEISALLLKHLKNIAENYLKKPIKKAVITVPAYFDEAARNATKNAAILADLEVLRLINEPTSAAIAYGLDNNSTGTFIIFDLGGGTFDISILKLQQGVFKVIGVSGDSALGGDDFDHLIVSKIKTDCKIDQIKQEDSQKLRLIAKNIKENFSKSNIINQNFAINNQQYNFSLTKADFENLIAELVNKSIKITLNLIDDLEIDHEEIQGVVLVGGSTRISLIQQKLTEIFGANKILTNLNPDEIVAIGAAIQAHGLTNGSANLLLDVVPLSLGIETYGGIIEKIIERNSTIPTSYSKEFTTYADNQTGMKLHIVQGERELAQDCRSLAFFEIKNIPPLKAGVARVKITFTIDADGLLTVSAKEQSTGQIQTIEVKPTFGLSAIEIKEILINSAKNAKEDIQKRLLVETISEAKRSILAMNSAIEEDSNLLTTKQILEIEKQIKILEESFKEENKKQIQEEADKLEILAQQFAELKMNKYIKESLVNKNIDEIEYTKT